MTQSVRSEMRDSVAVSTLDDGKANAISLSVVEAVSARFDRAETNARAVLITGRSGMFSGGFDLAVMRGEPEDV